MLSPWKADASDRAIVHLNANHEQLDGSMKTFRLLTRVIIKTKKDKDKMNVETSSSISDQGSRKGFVLVVTLMMLVVISMSAAMLWQSTNTESLIAGNNRRVMHAKHSAMSGINHFMAMDFYASDVYEMLDSMSEAQLIEPIQIPGTKQSYDVKISTCCDQDGSPLQNGLFKVIATGYYGNTSGSHAVHVLEATIKTEGE